MRIPGYRIERLIAQGGMCSVYLAMQESLSRRVAIKVLKKFDSPQQAERFLHEARIIASLQHRNIITIHDVGAIGERYYIAMEYLEGGSLTDRIDQGMQPAAALDLLESMAGCLEFVHRKDIVHRDIKPGNILFHADGTPKLTDFGIAKQLDGNQELTLEGSAFGSPYYLSPEQAEDRPLDGRSDIYGLGIVFFQMLTGRRPYEESSHIETIVAHLSDPIPVLPKELSGYQGLLEQMIAKSPENRVSSGQDLVELVQKVRSSQLRPGERPPEGVQRVARDGAFARMRQASTLTKVSAVAVLLALGIGTLRLSVDGGDEPEAAPQLASRAQVIELSYEAGKTAVEPRVAVDEPEAEARVEESVVETTAIPAKPELSVMPEPASDDIVERRIVAPAEDLAPIAETAPAGQPQKDPDAGTRDDSRERIEGWMQAGDRALKANRLTTPAADNAYAYYLKVIELDPTHRGAQEGIDQIADRYAVLARRALDKEDPRRARLYMKRGIAVRRDHAGLLAIRSELDDLSRVAASTPAPVIQSKELPSQEETRISLQEFEGTSVTSRGPVGTGNIVKDFKNAWRSVFD